MMMMMTCMLPERGPERSPVENGSCKDAFRACYATHLIATNFRQSDRQTDDSMLALADHICVQQYDRLKPAKIHDHSRQRKHSGCS